MGQAIVYCSNCSAQLRGSDFDARKAFKVDDLNFCAKCCREVLGSEPAPAHAHHTPKPSSTNRIAVVPHAPLPAPPEQSGSMTGILAAVGIGIVVVILIFAFSGGEERRPSPPPSAASSSAPAPRPARDTAAEDSLSKAERTENLAARREARGELERKEWKLQEAKAPQVPKVEKPVALVKAGPPPSPISAPAPAPVAADRSREVAARAAKWEAALSPSTARDYPAALAALEKLGDAAADLPLLKSVASLHQEALNALARTPKGQKVVIDYRDATGAVRRAEASFMESENGLVELRSEAGAVEIEVGEIAPSWLADHLKSRGSAVDPAAAALFCLLEGDEAGARRLLGDKAGAVPERYWTYARKVAGEPEPGRALYQEALALAGGFATAADAVPKYQALLRDHAESPIVRRNKATIAARLQQCARDYLFVAGDLKPSGSFKPAKSAKGNGCWTSEADVDPPQLKDNFLELSYSVLPDAAYKCWIYAGGCCQETFEFWVQGTELKGGKEKEPVEPGSNAAMNVKPWLSSLKKTHAGHTGPKQPSHWEWVPIALPKYAKPGLQQLRVLTSQKGFSVAFACVTTTRSGPPKEFDLRELEKSRATAPVVVPAGPSKGVVLYSAALDGTERRLMGECRDKALYGIPAFNACFAGVDGNPVFTMTAQGECRATYYLKTATALTARFRVRRGDITAPYDVNLQAVAGRPTDVRIPFSDFKPAYGAAGPALVAGDFVTAIYFFGPADCGLRIDALSVVESKGEPAARTASEALGKIVFSENFDNGPGKFQNGEVVDGGIKGSKAIAVTVKGIDSWGAWSVRAKDSVTISFKVKPLTEVSQIFFLMWSDSHKDNGRYWVDGLRKGEWKEVRIKASDMRTGAMRDGPPIDLLNNVRFLITNPTPDARILIDDFEIRE